MGYVVGLGDRHVQNILIDTNTAEFIHIDLGKNNHCVICCYMMLIRFFRVCPSVVLKMCGYDVKTFGCFMHAQLRVEFLPTKTIYLSEFLLCVVAHHYVSMAGVAFEQGKTLPTPETVPFRLTRDFVDGMGVAGVEGVFRCCCEKTMEVMRVSHEELRTIVEVGNRTPLDLPSNQGPL